MTKFNTFKTGFYLLLLIGVACREAYTPPVKKLATGYLVVDGVIIAGNDSTIIRLSRTNNVHDTTLPPPEPGAVVEVTGESNDKYALTDMGNGNYVAGGLPLDFNKKYRLNIHTKDGREYQSEFVPAKQTPLVDSLGWYPDTGYNAHIHITTHDPANNTRYYRWDYVETWEYHSSTASLIDWLNGQVVLRSPDGGVYFCWLTANSSDIHVFSTTKLDQDVAYQVPITVVPLNSEKLKLKYSILVKQYALTKEAYEFWQSMQRNTEQLGTLFDAQPTQLQSNIHCVTNPAEVVIGYVSVSSVQSKRIFIKRDDLPQGYFFYYYMNYECKTRLVLEDSLDAYLPASGHRGWVMVDKPLFGPGYILMPAECADCREHGGTNVKPLYWP